MIFEGIARRWIGLKGGKSTIEARFTHQESLAVGQVEPLGFEMTRANRRFYAAYNGTVPTGVAPVQAFPTTAVQWSINNYEPVTGKTYFFETIGAFPLSGTPGIGGLILVSIYPLSTIAGAMATGFAIMPAGQPGSFGASKSNALVRTATTIAFNQPGAVGAGVAGNQIVNRDIQGRIAVPPQCALGINVLALAGTTPLFLPIAEWIEQETDME
jgi:hypothetical protein